MVFRNKDMYKGGFANDKFNGKGKYIWNNNNKEYNGNFLDGKMHGNGILKWNNNMYYKGRFNNGIKEGKGEFGFINGDKFLFEFINGLPNDKGYLIENNNKLSEIFYNKGKIINPKRKSEIIFIFQ